MHRPAYLHRHDKFVKEKSEHQAHSSADDINGWIWAAAADGQRRRDDPWRLSRSPPVRRSREEGRGTSWRMQRASSLPRRVAQGSTAVVRGTRTANAQPGDERVAATARPRARSIGFNRLVAASTLGVESSWDDPWRLSRPPPARRSRKGHGTSWRMQHAAGRRCQGRSAQRPAAALRATCFMARRCQRRS